LGLLTQGIGLRPQPWAESPGPFGRGENRRESCNESAFRAPMSLWVRDCYWKFDRASVSCSEE